MKIHLPEIKSNEQRPLVLKRLRKQFVAINMATALIVLACTLGLVSYFDYKSRVDAVYSELDYVLTEATTPRAEQVTGKQSLKHTKASAAYTAAKAEDGGASSANEENAAPVIGSPSSNAASVILISAYEIAPSGIYTLISDYTNATIPEQTIIRANEMVMEGPSDSGHLDEYDLYYMRTSSPDNSENYLVAYADGSSVNGWSTLALTLTLGGLGALLVLFVINIYFSRWALRPVELSIKQQQQFTADASHELKTPLTVIIANMEILRSQPGETVAEQMQWIESTSTEAERMQLLVNDMLTLSRAESQESPTEDFPKESVDFSDLVEGEALQFESVAFERGVEIDSDIEEGLCVLGDRERLGRMVATLVDNACKYAGAGSKETGEQDGQAEALGICENPTVTISLTRKQVAAIGNPVAELKVHNTGPAIREEDLPHIFTRFYRADKARTSSKGSYGLGLAIGKEIAAAHGGEISVASTEEKGTTFTVTLPLLAHDPSMNSHNIR